MIRANLFKLVAFAALILPMAAAAADDPPLPQQAEQSLRRATEFFRIRVSSHGGYVWRYSEDLSKREGERRTGAETVWVQPPGTPSVGMAFLEAYELTGHDYLLEAARAAGMCLVQGQLRSGGWEYRIEFEPGRRRRYAYRADGSRKAARNTTILDDNTTQHSLRFLMRLDKTLEFADAPIHEAARYAISSLRKAQYPNGAWPQRFDRFPVPDRFPVKRASYPQSWSRKFPRTNFYGHYTFNDRVITSMIDVMFEAAQTYGDTKCRESAEKGGGFILLAQMPEPQPGWAQQYDVDMHPAWARKMEPPAVTGGESRGVLWSLLQLYRHTGDRKYLEPVPKAIAYFRRSVLPDGRLARFYELKTNRPLYVTGRSTLTYDDSDLRDDYRFDVGNWLDDVQIEYDRLNSLSPEALNPPGAPPVPKLSQKLETRVRTVIAALDEDGRWVETGRLRYHGQGDPVARVIDCRRFIKNLRVLSRYVAAAAQ